MKFKFVFSLLFVSCALFSQSVAEADALFNNRQFAKARSVYEMLLRRKPNDNQYHFKLGRCLYELKDDEKAIAHFQQCGSRIATRDMYLGELYFRTYRFDESVQAYQTYVGTLKPEDPKLSEYENKIKISENWAKYMSKIDNIVIVDSCVVSKSEFLKCYKFSPELGSLTQGQLKLSSKKLADKITYTTQRQDRVYFSDTIHGHTNIFTKYKLLDSWSEPASISSVINTKADENYPFVLLDGVTVYFGSDGANSLGGYDIFVTRFTPANNSYLVPENIGFPFNSPANDYMMVIDEQRKLGWFATDRNQPAGKVIIYTFIPNETRVAVKSDDKDYLRNAAQLKTYRRKSVNLSLNPIAVENNAGKIAKQIDFVINDSVVYTSVSQFKSEDAGKNWNELQQLTLDLNTIRAKLNLLRTKYSTQEADAEKKSIESELIELEKKSIELEKNISNKTMQIRNAENLFKEPVK